jgi:mannose-6-phosphate isomerase-like protein (cupin superfamily)
MTDFPFARPAAAPDALAPDGSEVRLLAALKGGSFAHFTLPAGATARAVRHRSVEEIWWFVSGSGVLWRATPERERIDVVKAGDCVAIPLGTSFQFRADEGAPLVFVAATMPPWPGEGEAEYVEGMWPHVQP